MHDTPLGWTLYLEDLERQAIRLRRRQPARPLRARLGAAIAAARARLRGAPAADGTLRTAVDSGAARG